MHIGVADKGIEDQTPDIFCNIGISSFYTQNHADAPVACVVVLGFGKLAENLSEILSVNWTIWATVEPLHRQGLSGKLSDAFGQAVNRVEIQQLKLWDVHSHEAGNRHH